MNKRTFKIVGGFLAFVLVAPVVLAGAFLLEEHVRGRISLAHYRRVLVARGEKLTPQALEADRPSGENGAPEIMAASAELIKGEVMPDHYPPRMKLTESGRAVTGFREKEWGEGGVTYRWDELASELETNEPVLQRLRVALRKPVLDNQLDLSQGALARFTHLAPMKQLSQWFGARAQLELHDGELHEAVDDLAAQIELVRALARDGIVISELVRVAIASIARTGTWEALQADGWSDADLARLQQAWEKQHFADGMIGGYQGELVFADVSYQQCRASNHWTFQMLFGLEDYGEESDRPLWERAFRQVPYGAAVADFLKEQGYCRVWRFAWLDQNERHYLEEMEELLTIMRTAAARKSLADVNSALSRLADRAASRNIYDRLRYPRTNSILSLWRCVIRAMRAETERSIVLCAIALKRYAGRHGAAPSVLGLLVPDFLASVPTDYMDGKPLKYHLNGDRSFVLYSAGEDGRDDGGDTSLAAGKSNLHDVWSRKDYVWPAPATTEETEALGTMQK